MLASVRDRTPAAGPPKLPNQPESSISSAVQDCLARCYRGGTPLGVLAEFMGELREKGWSQADVRKTEAAVRKVLAGVMTKGPDGDS
jgi:hypothetical protein